MIKLSIILPTYNRLDALDICLKALCQQQNVLENWQVLIVNDGGESVKNLVVEYQKYFNIRQLTQENKGPASARNLGVENADGEIIAFLDDDCIPEKNWISEILSCSKMGAITGGLVTNWYSSNLYSESSQLLLDFLYQQNPSTIDAFFTSNNFSLYKTDFIKIGGFSTRFRTSAGEDREFCVRARNMGLRLRLNESIKINHAHYLTFKSFFRLHKKYGAAAYEYQLEMSKQNINVTKKPKLNFYIRLLKFPFSRSKYNLSQKVKIDLLLLICQLAVVTGYFHNRFRLIRQ